MIAAYFNQNGIDARYVQPREAGIVVTSEPGHARIIPSSYDKIEELTNATEVLVIPGFFGLLRKIKSVPSHVEDQTLQVLSLLQVLRQTSMKTLQTLMVSLQPTLALFTNHTLNP